VDVVRPSTVDRVEREQVCRGKGIGLRVVDVNDLEVRPIPCGSKCESTHSSEAVDAHASAHELHPQVVVAGVPQHSLLASGSQQPAGLLARMIAAAACSWTRCVSLIDTPTNPAC